MGIGITLSADVSEKKKINETTCMQKKVSLDS